MFKQISERSVVLEQLLDLGKEIVKDKRVIENYVKLEELRDYIQEIVNNSGIEYDEGLIEELIQSSTGSNLGIAFGVYTGCLVTKLYNNNQKLGRETNIQIRNAEMDYILCMVKKADRITIEKCRGADILSYAGAFQGKVEEIVIKDAEGRQLGGYMGSYGGKVNRILFYNVRGPAIGVEVGSHGRVGQLVMDYARGDRNLSSFSNMGFHIGREGSIETLIMDNIEDDDFIGAGINNVKTLLIINKRGKVYLSGAISSVKKAIIYNVTGNIIRGVTNEDVSGENSLRGVVYSAGRASPITKPKEYNKELKKAGLKKVIDKLESLNEQSSMSELEGLLKILRTKAET